MLLRMDRSADFVSTTEAARRLRVSRRQVGALIASERLGAHRFGPHWYIHLDVLEAFAATYKPMQYPRRSGSQGRTVWEALEVLSELGECSTSELAEALDRHEGNVRKYLIILRHRGFAERVGDLHRITAAGRAHLSGEARIAS